MKTTLNFQSGKNPTSCYLRLPLEQQKKRQDNGLTEF